MAKSWKERQEEEARILAEMDEAMKEQEEAKKAEAAQNGEPPQEEKKLHCPKCGNYLQKDGRCPACGHRIYVPMSEDTQKTAQWIIGVACIIGFILIYFVFAK